MYVDARELYSQRASLYDAFVSSFLYPQGLRACLEASEILRDGMSVLDAGCGTGKLSFALLEAARRRGLDPPRIAGCDFTPAMLDRFQRRIDQQGTQGIELAEADVLRPSTLPATRGGYDLVMSSGMLEYIPPDRMVDALANMGSVLSKGGHMLLFVSRDNWLTRILMTRLWSATRHSRGELESYLSRAGFGEIVFGAFPNRYGWLNLWGHVVVARKQ